MVRKPCFDKNGMKKGAWSAEEDNKLRAYIERYGYWNWRELPKYAGLSRCGKSCRLRWMNYLRPNVKRGNYSKEEEDIIIKLHEELGNKWSAIAAKLPGRSDNEIKNHWHTHLKKLVKQNPTTSEVKEQSHNIFPFESNQKEQSIKTSPCEANTKRESTPEDVVVNGLSQQTSETSLLSPEPSSSGFSSLSSINSELFSGINWTAEDSFSSMETFAEPTGNFWSGPFLADTSYNQNDSSSFGLVEGGFIYPYISCYDDVNDLFYQLMDEIPMN